MDSLKTLTKEDLSASGYWPFLRNARRWPAQTAIRRRLSVSPPAWVKDADHQNGLGESGEWTPTIPARDADAGVRSRLTIA